MALVNNETVGIGAGIGGGLPFGGGGFGGGFGVPFGVPVGVGGGYSGGGDGIGLIALLALLGGRGFGGGHDHGHGCRDDRSGGDSNAAVIAALSALNNRNDRDDDNCCESLAVLSKLASLEGAIPAVGSQIQLALANLAAGLTAQNNSNTQTVTTQLGQIQIGQLVQANALQKAIGDVDTNVDRVGAAVINTIRDDGNATRALITENVINGLRDDKVILANEVVELRHEHRHSEHRRELDAIRINIENNNLAVAAQAQFQQQRQTDLDNQRTRYDFERLHNELNIIGSQFARATNNSVNVGNSGAIGTSQTANPTNVNARG
jgi:hypothetical protein